MSIQHENRYRLGQQKLHCRQRLFLLFLTCSNHATLLLETLKKNQKMLCQNLTFYEGYVNRRICLPQKFIVGIVRRGSIHLTLNYLSPFTYLTGKLLSGHLHLSRRCSLQAHILLAVQHCSVRTSVFKKETVKRDKSHCAQLIIPININAKYILMRVQLLLIQHTYNVAQIP